MKCALCGARAVHRHHVLSRQFLKREGYGDRLTDVRNLMDLCATCHFNHEAWSRRIWREELPASVWEFAREFGEPFVVRLEQDHPVRGRSATSAGASRA